MEVGPGFMGEEKVSDVLSTTALSHFSSVAVPHTEEMGENPYIWVVTISQLCLCSGPCLCCAAH